MPRSRHPAPLIVGDDQEQYRIRLEHNLRNSETAIHLSSATESDADSYESQDDLESLEYPRHNSGPAPFGEFSSFDRRVRDYIADEDAPGHGWSYRTGDDYEEGINPYGGESLSTIAHHASAVTLSAGLGGRGARRDVSISGAEYDPERPLNEIIAGVNSKLSMLGSDASRSKRQTLDNMTVDPHVVEDTAELDQLLETGAQPAMHSRVVRPASPVTSGSSSHSESDHTLKSRPKLSDALRNVALSPKRPRSPQFSRALSPSPKQQATSSLSKGAHRPSITHVPTPRPGKRNAIFPSNAAALQPNPAVVLQPPTPSSGSSKSAESKFTRMAKGLAKDIEYEKGQLGKSSASSTKRPERTRSATAPTGNLFNDGTTSAPERAPAPRSSARDRSRIQLPDVTGITNAIESPAKGTVQYYAYRAEGKIRETENRLLHTLNTVQMKIQQLEEENGISRRRVRELEMELEDCKREVARERTRLIQQEEFLKQQQATLRAAKGKARARDVSADTSLFQERYKEAVEEKKALEALITSLRTHLARLTSELSSHRELLTELRTLRDADSATLREKSLEITRLKNEVERLAGEVEVLRGVVEEGLRERRAAKEASLQQSQDDELHHDEGESAEDQEDEEDEEDEDGLATETEDAGLSYADSASRVKAFDRTMRTDRATEGSSQVNETRAARFMDSAEFERISAEIDERRFDRSGSAEDLSQFSHTRSPAQSPSPRSRRKRTAADDSVAYDLSLGGRRAPSPDVMSDPEDAFDDPYAIREPGPSTRLPASHEDHGLHSSRRQRAEAEEPFPKIRGKRLERLFFAAPEHDARTCATCNRRRREEDEHPVSQAWRNRRAARSRHGSDDDEGFAEGSDNLDQHPQGQTRGYRGKRRERSIQDINEVRSVAHQEGLPPQTIVARIIRELEDDFTHYKGIYIELADQYKEMDAASNVAKRNTLAKHLREVVDILEQKGDQIASLYDQLSFKDKPASGTGSHRSGKASGTRTR